MNKTNETLTSSNTSSSPFVEVPKVELLIKQIINLSRSQQASMLELAQACKAIQLAATQEINAALVAMVADNLGVEDLENLGNLEGISLPVLEVTEPKSLEKKD